MKKILLLLLLISCGRENEESLSGVGDSPQSNSSPTLSKIMVKDSSSQSMGYLVNMYLDRMTLITSEGYLYEIDLNGFFTNFGLKVYRSHNDYLVQHVAINANETPAV